ncbi:MAG TPA: HD domain-containing phosphohydrolase, partial [Candidatus Limnocylindrales bacterium]|nr:HD domain-containing phosphohydrolase [Candidatus Limnocylindrales bacterium]
MAPTERLPGDLYRSMFRIAAVAFIWSGAADAGSSFVGTGQHVNYPVVIVLGLLSIAGGAVTWVIPWHRLPVDRFLGIIVMPGVAILTAMLMSTGGVHSQVMPLFVAPAVFMAAAFDLRMAVVTGALCLAGAALPLTQGWDDAYFRTLIVLGAATALSAYVPSRVRAALTREYERRTRQQEEGYVATIGALAAALDAKDRYTEEHSRETATLALNVGRRLGLSPEELRFLEYGALLHDIGKIGIPGYILHKPGALTAEEFDIMKEHPVIGERILASVPFLKPLAPVVRAEHERWDGTGYPDGLRGEEIPIAARIVHACDAFHAMATDRAYREALPRERILAEFREQSGKQFDPRVVEVMLQVIEEDDPELHAAAQHAGTPAPAAPISGPRSWAQHLESIEVLGARLSRVASIDEICRLIGETIVAILPQDHCRILLLNRDGRHLEIVYLSASEKSEYQSITKENAAVEMGEGITGWVAEQKRGAVLGDAERHPKAAHVAGTSHVDESMLAVPVVFEDELLGVIVVNKLGLNQYALDHLRLLTILANQAAVSIAHARLIDRLASAARTDPLTGLGNRPAFEEALARQLDNPAARLSIALFDIDRLKQTNAAFG